MPNALAPHRDYHETMNIIACYNIKGGVGKTASAVNLAHLASQQGARTLLWDLDPQGASSFYFRIKTKKSAAETGLLRKQRSISSSIEPTQYENLNLLPAERSDGHMTMLLGNARRTERTLSSILQGVMDNYDYIFLDCPPNIALLSENIFHSSDLLLIPTIPTPLSLRTLGQIISYKRENPKMFPRLMSFFSMVDRRKTIHKLIVDRPPALDAQILTSQIPYAAEVERMGIERRPLTAYAKSTRAAKAYTGLWQELLAELSPAIKHSLRNY